MSKNDRIPARKILTDPVNFLAFGFGILAFIDPSLVLTWQSLLIAAFCAVRAIPEVIKKA